MTSKRMRDAEELKKKVVLKYMLKKVVRKIIINSQWLDENDDDTKISANVKKNIALLLRTKRKIGMLTAPDKSLIRTPHQLRTIAERKRLCTLFAGLKCFFWIPPKLRARLVPVIKFMSLGPGRVIIRQDDWPLTIFFIVAGEVEMMKATDKLSKNVQEEGEIIYGPGDCIGDVSLLEDCARYRTFIATSHCELLVMFDNDFNSILKPYMQKIWNEKKTALRALDYFNFLNEDQMLRASKLSTLKQYKPLDTIYSQDRGTLTNVHFVLSGECLILQCLNMKVIKKNGKKTYQLQDVEDDYNVNMNSDISVNKKVIDSPPLSNSINKNGSAMIGKFGLDPNIKCGFLNMPQLSTLFSMKQSNTQGTISYTDLFEEEDPGIDERNSHSFKLFDGNFKAYSYESETNIKLDSDSDETEIYTVSSTPSSSSTASLNTDVFESHFIDVGSLTFGGIFGLGEKMQHRVIMARNTVQCLSLPRFFLLDKEQNPGNVWQRRLFYLDSLIPSREALFDDFLRTLKWKKFKYDFLNQSLFSNTSDVAKDEDIPILCRIEEAEEFD